MLCFGKDCRCVRVNLRLQKAASFGSSILFGQPLCSESRQFVLIHFGI